MKAKEFYKTTAWKHFSRYILLKHSIDGLNAKCYTSGKYIQINTSDCHAGHLIKVFDGSKTNFATAFDENNVRPQSKAENTHKGGSPDVFYRKLVSEVGQAEVDKMYIRKNNICKLGKFELEILAKMYKTKFDEQVKRWQFNPWKQ